MAVRAHRGKRKAAFRNVAEGVASAFDVLPPSRPVTSDEALWRDRRMLEKDYRKAAKVIRYREQVGRILTRG